MSKGFITGTNEELIKAYKESRDESWKMHEQKSRGVILRSGFIALFFLHWSQMERSIY